MNEMTEMTELEIMSKEAETIAITDGIKAALARDLKPVAERMTEYSEFAMSVKVNGRSDEQEATGIVKKIDDDLKLVKGHEILTKITDGLYKLHRRATAFRALFTDPMERDKKRIRVAIIGWQEKERSKLQQAADEKARKERERQEAEAARQRKIEDDARRAADDARRKAEKAKGEERARLAAEANAADRKAEAAAVKAETRTERAAAVIAPTVMIEAPKSGLRTVTVWSVRGINETDFYNGVIRDANLRGYVKIDTVRMTRSKAANPSLEIPGVMFEQIVR